MLSILERNALLDRVWDLARQQDPQALSELLSSLPEEDLLEEPEFGIQLARAWTLLGRPQPALRLLRRLRTVVPATVEDRLLLRIENAHCVALLSCGELSDAESGFSELLASASVAEDTLMLGSAANNLAVIAGIRCQWDAALAYLSHSLVAFQQIGNRREVAACYYNLGMIYRELDFLTTADAHLEHALAHYRRVSPLRAAAAEGERALLIRRRGDARLAEATARRAYITVVTYHNPRQLGEILRVLGIIVAGRDPEEARACLDHSLELATLTDNRLLRAEVLEEIAVLAQRAGDAAGADERMAEAAAIYHSLEATVRAGRARARLVEPAER